MSADVRDTCPGDELKIGWTELSSTNWPSPVCPLEFGPNYGENRINEDRIIEWRLYFQSQQSVQSLVSSEAEFQEYCESMHLREGWEL
jgi:hypothetical protein